MKVLILSHNSIYSDTNMGVTSRSLLSGFSPDSLCQINIRDCTNNTPQTPTFIINEKDVLKSVLTRKSYWHHSIVFEENKDDTVENHTESSRNSAKLVLRDLVWNLGKWKSKQFNQWISDNAPDRIFLMPGDSTFIYKIAAYVSEHFRIPLITFFGDDYSNGINDSNGFLDILYRKKIRRQIEIISKKSNALIFISDSLRVSYNEQFDAKGITVRTAYTEKQSIKALNTPLKMTYAGNLTSGRFSTIQKVCELMDEINKEKIVIDFEVYAPELQSKDMNQLNNNYQYYKGFLESNEVSAVLNESDILLHVETFDADLFSSVKHSFSTKLASYLASGRLIVAFGPLELNSINYLKEHNVALVSDSISNLKQSILSILEDSSIASRLIQNAAELVDLNHDPIRNANSVMVCIEEACNNEN